MSQGVSFAIREAAGAIPFGSAGHARGAELRRRQRIRELQAEIVLDAQHTQPRERAGHDVGGVRAEERRRHREPLARRNRDRQRDVVAFEAPRPRHRIARLAEQRDAVILDAARKARSRRRLEHVLELHDVQELVIAAVAQQQPEELVRQRAMLRMHEIEAQSRALRRPVGPLLALGAVERQQELVFHRVRAQPLRELGIATHRFEQGTRRRRHGARQFGIRRRQARSPRAVRAPFPPR